MHVHKSYESQCGLYQRTNQIEDFALVEGSWVIRANENKVAAACS